MSIRMLKAWNSYPVGTIVTTLSGAEEARLIGIGFASADLDGDQEYSYMPKVVSDANGLNPVLVNTKDNSTVPLGGGSSSSYSFTPFSKSDQADTPASNKTTITPTAGAGIVRLDYTKTTNTPKGTAMYVVFNALNSTDADTKLGSDSTRFTIAIGTNREFQFAVGSECVRIDFITNAATPETATSTLITGEYGILP